MTLKDTLELLSEDESASDNERMLAKRMLKKYSLDDAKDDVSCICVDISLYGEEQEQYDLAYEITHHIQELPVCVARDCGAWKLYGIASYVYALKDILAYVNERMKSVDSRSIRLALMRKTLEKLLSGRSNSIVDRRKVEDSLCATKIVYAREHKTRKLDERKAEKIAQKVLCDFTKDKE